jgi:hypothetical protein
LDTIRIWHRHKDLPRGASSEVWLECTGTDVKLTTRQQYKDGSGGAGWGWKKCGDIGCYGASVTEHDRCLFHSAPVDTKAYLEAVSRGRDAVVLRGTQIDGTLLKTILESSLVRGSKVMAAFSLAGAEINSRIELNGLTFENYLDLSAATARKQLIFRKCTFKKGLFARFTYFDPSPPFFEDCEFMGEADFSNVDGKENSAIVFADCSFDKSFSADGITVPLVLRNCTCKSDVAIRRAKTNIIQLNPCSVRGQLMVADTHCASFQAPYLRAAGAHQFGPLIADHSCDLSHAHFEARVKVDIEAEKLDLTGSQFSAGGHILVGNAEVLLPRVIAGGALRVAGNTSGSKLAEVLDIQDSDTGSMSFAHVDMSRCVFYGAHGLGTVTIEPTVRFANTTQIGYTRRRYVADELEWRLNRGGFIARGWKRPDTAIRAEISPGKKEDVATVLTASQVAGVYRNLRRSFEARADEPGAADFYYGEMEMRRHDDQTNIAERAIIFLYWMVSGYGLRASRAFAWLFVLIGAGTYTMAKFGFEWGLPRTYREGFWFCLRAGIPGLHQPAELSTTGNCVEIAMTALSPVLFGLALLALRGRIKR